MASRPNEQSDIKDIVSALITAVANDINVADSIFALREYFHNNRDNPDFLLQVPLTEGRVLCGRTFHEFYQNLVTFCSGSLWQYAPDSPTFITDHIVDIVLRSLDRGIATEGSHEDRFFAGLSKLLNDKNMISYCLPAGAGGAGAGGADAEMELAEAIVSPSPILPLRGSFSLGLLVRCRIRLWNGLRPTMKVLLFDKLLRDPIPSLSTAEDIDWPNMFTAKDVEGAFQKALGRRCLLVLFFALQAHYDALAALQQQQPPPQPQQRQQRSLPSSVSDRDAAVNRVVSYSKGHKSLLFELLTGPAALTPALWSNVHVDVLRSLPTAFAAMLCLWRKCGTLKPSAFLCTDTEEHALRALQKRMCSFGG